MNRDALLEYTTLSSPENIKQLKQILAQCFNTSFQRNEIYFNRIGTEQFRTIRQAEEVIGGLAILPMAQWWGGKRVSITGIASVGIAPEHRGLGIDMILLQHTLRELCTNGVALALLHSTTQQIYRQVGYEQAGIFCSWEIPLEAIGITQRLLPLHRIESSQQEILHALYQQQVPLNNGHLRRHPIIWQRLFQGTDQSPVYAYVIGAMDQPEGYLIFSQHSTDAGMGLRVKDWVMLTPEAGYSLWAFLAHYRPQAQTVRWRSTMIDPLASLLPEQTAKLRRLRRWMLRIVDVSAALQQRGYPADVQGELHLDIQDDLLHTNAGQFILSVTNGQGQLTRGGRGEFKLDIRGLVPLYTGLFTPQQLKATGRLQAPEAALVTATRLFAGTTPWMPDVF